MNYCEARSPVAEADCLSNAIVKHPTTTIFHLLINTFRETLITVLFATTVFITTATQCHSPVVHITFHKCLGWPSHVVYGSNFDDACNCNSFSSFLRDLLRRLDF